MLFLSSSQLGVYLKIVIAVILLWIKAVPQGRVSSTETSSPAFQCPTGFFSFGTSLSDTGNGAFALPGRFSSENPPYGNTFFGRNAMRFSDGRLVVDFFDLAFGYPLLTGYLQSIGPDFRYGVNFAISGATAIAESPAVPFHLDFQVAQFSRFKQLTQAINQDPGIPCQYKRSLPENSMFTKGLYILSFGRNDLTLAYKDGLTPSRVFETIVPQIVQSIVRGIQNLYDDGARNFVIFNLSPQGCSPQYLTNFGPWASKADFDADGCLAPYNEVIQGLNYQIYTAVEDLRMTFNDALIFDFDYYQAYISVLHNPQSFGFAKTRDACCGIGGQYNYNSSVQCSRSVVVNSVTVTADSCNNPSEYISWDGVHYTDAFNRVIAELLLTGKFLDPPISMKTECQLDFSKFKGVNFTRAYPDGYIVGPPNLNIGRFNPQPYFKF